MIRICGWDVGIRHLAFCEGTIPIDNFSLEQFTISRCGVIDLLADNEPFIYDRMKIVLPKENEIPKEEGGCCVKLKNKYCASPVKLALFTAENKQQNFCSRHQNHELEGGKTKWLLLEKNKKKKPNLDMYTTTVTADEKQNVFILCCMCNQNFTSVKQPRWVCRPEMWNRTCIHPVCYKCAKKPLPTGWQIWTCSRKNNISPEPKNTILQGPAITDTDEIMQKLVRRMKKTWQHPEMDIVWIENQPTFVNPRMKSLQMILYTHFQSVLSDKGGSVRFVNPNQKWKNAIDLPEKPTYKSYKQQSVNRFIDWLNKQGNNKEFLEFFNMQKKKDDMADAFWIIAASISDWKINNNFYIRSDIKQETQ